jgi:hypothetical protein
MTDHAKGSYMKYLRVIDGTGDTVDYEAEFVPRIGERIFLVFGRGNDQVRAHYYRVKDVMYNLGCAVEHQVSILIEEEHEAEAWPQADHAIAPETRHHTAPDTAPPRRRDRRPTPPKAVRSVETLLDR